MTSEPIPHRTFPSPAGSGVVEIVIAVCLLILAGWFVWGRGAVTLPRVEPAAVSLADLDTRPLRIIQTDEPVVTIAGFERRCMECHRLFESPKKPPQRLTQHQDILLDHGLNDRCFNCHDRENRDMLTLRGEEAVPYSEVARLCSMCHGPTYRDWERGMHGRTSGGWDPGGAAYRRLRCSECHDPHAPAVHGMKPLPGPNTLRMGHPVDREHIAAAEQIDPLRKWQHVLEERRADDEDHGSRSDDPGAAEQGE
ncbi:MAG: hypothetical protein KAS72_08575 [Phycisphaerales bacterium]|nr:hypothetical protein [Phycisphaerales bacterium]